MKRRYQGVVGPEKSSYINKYSLIGWAQDSCEAPKLIPGHPLAEIYTLQKVRSKFDILGMIF